ncbi:MAG: ABC transporter ATP-binding protein [Planctomycetaceae bacterium]|nr:ABC transporter ATP-binding protein [Planctomycetaceae bacterium]MBL4886696.1 ABC transporter ATP-binding protein [Planctomycetaceae bacterium]
MHIQIENLHKTYRRGETELEVLRGISCEFTPGSFNFILGPSGSGKSSLLYLLGVLDQATSGRILIDDSAIDSWDEATCNAYRKSDVGFIFQNFNLMSNLTALDNVLVPFLPQGIDAEITQRAEQLLERVGLKDRIDHKPNHLSGGEQQRVAIARALLKKPKLILADEPTGELDSTSGHMIFQLLRELGQEQQAIIIVVTHDERHILPEDIVHRIEDGLLIDIDEAQQSV